MKHETVGIKPALPLAVVAAVVTYLLSQEVVDFAPAVDLILNAAAVALAVAVAGVGKVRRVNGDGAQTNFGGGQRGYTVIELAVGVLLFLILLVVALKVIDRI